jgi:hypothetical protein
MSYFQIIIGIDMLLLVFLLCQGLCPCFIDSEWVNAVPRNSKKMKMKKW